MKSLMKIIRRYIFSAAVLVMTVIGFNAAVLCYIGYQSSRNLGRNDFLFAGEQMNRIASELSVSDTEESQNDTKNYGQGEMQYQLSEQGYDYLREYRYLWAMLLNQSGNVVWSWQLPKEIPKSYNIADVAQFSRWYLMDYPVRVWETGDNLLVCGYGKSQYVRIHLVYPGKTLRSFPEYLFIFVGMNVLLFLVLALWFAYRFYRSLRPVFEGIDALAEREPIALSEKGMTGELAKRLNQTSQLLETQDEKLRQRDDARTSWIAGVSHDIRTPLALIMGYSDTLAASPELGEEERRQAEAVRQQSLLIKQLIEDLNLTSKLEYHAQPLRLTEYCPAVLLRETAVEYYNEGLDRSFEIAAEAAPQTERVKQRGDVPLLKRALRNIIGNSIRHNPKGCQIMLHLSLEMGCVIWNIQDSGPGIPGKVVDILEKQTSYLEEEIHVMGLRIVKQIVTAHGGYVSFPQNGRGGYEVEFVFAVEE